MNDQRGHLTNLLHSYAHFADRFDLDAFIGLFSEDAVIDMGSEIDTSQFRAMMEQNSIDTRGLCPRHILSNLMFSELGDSAALGAMYFTYQQTIDSVPTILMSGVYDFELARTAAGWKIQRWQISVDTSAAAE